MILTSGQVVSFISEPSPGSLKIDLTKGLRAIYYVVGCSCCYAIVCAKNIGHKSFMHFLLGCKGDTLCVSLFDTIEEFVNTQVKCYNV